MGPPKLRQRLMGPNLSVPDDLKETSGSGRKYMQTLSGQDASEFRPRSKTPDNLEAIHSMRDNKAICRNPDEHLSDDKQTDTKMIGSSREMTAGHTISEE